MSRMQAGLALVLVSAMASLHAEELTLRQRDMVEDSMAGSLVLPETALWQFSPLKPYMGTARLVCGHVNFQSSMRRYVGYRRFYAILDQGRVTLSQIEDTQTDPSGRLHDKLDFLCGKA